MMELKWSELENIPTDNDDCIKTKFYQFDIGTEKFEIWHWFEETFNISIVEDLM